MKILKRKQIYYLIFLCNTFLWLYKKLSGHICLPLLSFRHSTPNHYTHIVFLTPSDIELIFGMYANHDKVQINLKSFPALQIIAKITGFKTIENHSNQDFYSNHLQTSITKNPCN